jgi:transcriptional regulator with XRE-family HTH domain
MFGKYVKHLRLKQKISLHEFCEHSKYDKGNWSRIERGLLPPPKKKEILKRLAKNLKLSPDKQMAFFNLAYVSRGEIPPEVMHKVQKDDALFKELLLFFKGIVEHYNKEKKPMTNTYSRQDPLPQKNTLEKVIKCFKAKEEKNIFEDEEEEYVYKPSPHQEHIDRYKRQMEPGLLAKKMKAHREQYFKSSMGDTTTEEEIKHDFDYQIAIELGLEDGY